MKTLNEMTTSEILEALKNAGRPFYVEDNWIGFPDAIKELTLRLERAEKDKDGAYIERNRLVAFLCSLYPCSIERHPEDDKNWHDDWRWAVYIDTPIGQWSWHLHDSHLQFFDHVSRIQGRKWDGTTTEQKYQAIELATRKGEYVCVPKEPTDEMLDAQYRDAGVGRDLARRCYQAMLQAGRKR